MSHRLLALIVAGILAGVATADFVFFITDSDGAGTLIEGTVDAKNSVNMISIHHKYGDIYLPRDLCKVYKAEDPRKKQLAALKAAAKKQDVDQLWKLGKSAIRRGNAGNYFRAAEIIADLDPDHKEAARARRLAALIDEEIPESDEEEKKIRKQSGYEKPMQFARSPHFLLMHSLEAKKRKGVRTSVVEERLDMMERVYKAYLAFFWSRGYELPVPKERMFVVLTDTKQEFLEHAAQGGDKAAMFAEGYFDRKVNVSYFFEHRGTDEFQQEKELAQKQIGLGKKSNNGGDLIRSAKAQELIGEINCEQVDVLTCSHEVTHQMAHNTGLMPYTVGVPRWAAEGFACYFESPRDAQWSGIGAVNEERILLYRKLLKNHHPFCHIEMVISDALYREKDDHGEGIKAYAIGWSLTHFLMERHFDRLMNYYKKCANEPEEKMKTLGDHIRLFKSCFTEEQMRTMNVDWHLYMTRLKTELEEACPGLRRID